MEIFTIGGFNEVGKNMSVVRIGDDAVAFDSGFFLPAVIELQEQENGEQIYTEKRLRQMGAIPDDLLLDKLKNTDFDQYDVLIIPGGPASIKYLWGNEKIQKIIKYFHENKKIVAAICYAAIAPVQTGILQNINATVYPTDVAKAIFSENKTIFVNKGCVTLSEEKIITAQGPAFAKEFGEEIIKLLEK